MIVWTPAMATPQIYVNNGVRLVMASAGTANSPFAAARMTDVLPTFQFADINGDGLDDLVLRGTSQVECAMNTGNGFAPFSPCSTLGGQFSDVQGWASSNVNRTFAIANIHGPAVVGGLPTGVIFAPVIQSQVSDRYRYLCNDCFTNASDAAWNPQLRASQIVWGDFDGSGNDSPCFVRSDGLYLGFTRVFK